MTRQAVTFAVVMAFTAGLSFVSIGPAMSAGPVDIKITTVQLRQQQMGVGIERLAKYIDAQLKGKVRVRTYPAAQLYSGREELEAVMKGDVQMAYVIGAVPEFVEPSFQLIKLPFLFPDIDVSYKVLEGSVGKKIFSKLEAKGISVLGFVSSGTVGIHNSRHPIKNPDDFKGLKMRWSGPMGAATLKALGAISTVSVPEEMYTAFQQGMIDGGANPATVFYARKLYDVQKYITDAGMLNAVHVFLLGNGNWWNGLPPDIRSGVSEAIQQLVKEQRAEIEVENKKLFEQIAAKGCQVLYLAPAEEAAWKKAVQPVYMEFTPQIGTGLVDEARQEVERLSKTKK